MEINVTLIIGKDELSFITKEIVEYIIDQVINSNKELYDIEIKLREIFDDTTAKPLLIIDEFDPIIIDKIPEADMLVNILLAAGDAKQLSLIDSSMYTANYDFIV